MSKDKMVTVMATVVDAKYDSIRRAIMLNASVDDGPPQTVVLSELSIAPEGVEFSAEEMVEYMKEYAKRLSARTMPFNITLTESQLAGEGSGCTVKLQ